MRRVTENHRNSRAFSQYFSPRSKVKDITKHCYQPQYTSFYKETPMKPSQVQNRLSPLPPKRPLAYQTAELCCQDRPTGYQTYPSYQGPGTLGPRQTLNPTVVTTWHSAHPSGEPYHISPLMNWSQPWPQDGIGSSQNNAQTGQGTQSTVSPIAAQEFSIGAEPSFPSSYHQANSFYQLGENINNCSPSFSQGTDNRTEPNATFCEMIPGPDSCQQVQLYDAWGPMHTAQLQSPPLNSRAGQQVYPYYLSGTEYWCPSHYQWPNLYYEDPYSVPYLGHYYSYHASLSAPTVESSQSGICNDYCFSEDEYCDGKSEGQPPRTQPPNSVVDLNCTRFSKSSKPCHRNNVKPSAQLGNRSNTQTTTSTCETPTNTLQVSQSSSSNNFSGMKPPQSPQTKKGPSQTDNREPSQFLKSSGFSKSNEQIGTSSPSKHCTQIVPPGSQTPLKSAGGEGTKGSKSVVLRTNSNTLCSPKVNRHLSVHTSNSPSAVELKTPNTGKPSFKRKRSLSETCILQQTSKRKPTTSECKESKKHKPRPLVMPDDISELFTPDLVIHEFKPPQNTLKSKRMDENQKSLGSEKDCLTSHSTSSSATTGCASPFYKTATCQTKASCAMPISTLKRVTLKNDLSSNKKHIVSSSHHCTKMVSSITRLETSLKSAAEDGTKGSQPDVLKTKSNTLSPTAHQNGQPSLTNVNHHLSVHSPSSTSALAPKTINTGTPPFESRRLESDTCNLQQISRPKPTTSGCKTSTEHKSLRRRRSLVMADDVTKPFATDTMTCVVKPPQTNLKSIKTDEKQKLPTLGKDCPTSHTPFSSRTAECGSPIYKKATSQTCVPSTLPILVPTVILKRLNLENYLSHSKKMESTFINSPNGQSKEESTTLLNFQFLGKDSDTSEQISTSRCSSPPPLEYQTGDDGGRHVKDKDPIELDLNLDFRLELDFDKSQSSASSDEEQLISLQDMLTRPAKLPETPKKGTISEPSLSGSLSPLSKNVLPSTDKTSNYKNNLDQMLKEINMHKRSKEIETRLRTECNEGLLRIAEYEKADEDQKEDLCNEDQTKFLQRFLSVSGAFREVPPGEAVFGLEKFGHIFDQNSLQLRQCMVHPQERAQKTLLWSSPAQLGIHVNIGLFQDAYSHSPCPPQVMLFLFKMMSVHSERLVSDGILQALCDITCTAARQIVDHENRLFNVWVPSLANVTLVLMNMGAAFVTLYPFDNLQPSFTEGDVLEDLNVNSELPSKNQQAEFSEHNFHNIFKYLSYSMSLCPQAYSDNELLLLLTVVAQISLDTRFVKPSVHLEGLLYRLLNNFKDWEAMLPRICSALTSFTDDHRNMCHLVQVLPTYKRGKQLRQHLSLSLISKLLDGRCTYKPTQSHFQLSHVRRYLHRMQPSNLLRSLLNTSDGKQKEDEDTLDRQAYYLCNSLLTLTNEATSLQFYTAKDKKELLILSSQLEVHIKCDIRESKTHLYRSKVKDLVARIYTKWQMLLRKTQPLHDKVYDYWQPPDTL